MEKVKSLLKLRPTPQEQLREWQRRLCNECRVLERRIRDVQREEKNVEKAIRESAKRNDIGSAKALAKELVRSRCAVNHLFENKAGVMEEMVSDAVDSVLNSKDTEEEIEAEVDKVLASVAGETAYQLPDAARTQKIQQALTSRVPGERQAFADGADDEEEDLKQIRTRLTKVRS